MHIARLAVSLQYRTIASHLVIKCAPRAHNDPSSMFRRITDLGKDQQLQGETITVKRPLVVAKQSGIRECLNGQSQRSALTILVVK